MPTPDFSVQNNFPIASVIQAAQQNAQRQQQAQEYGQQQLVQGLGAIGQIGQSLLDRKRSIAQAMTMGASLGMRPEETAGLMPEQVEKIGAIKNQQIQFNLMQALMDHVRGGQSGASTVSGQPSSQRAGSQLTSGQSNPSGASLIPTSDTQSNSPTTPIPSQSSGMPIGSPVMNKATAMLAMKAAMALRPQQVMTQAQALQAGTVPKGTRIVNPAQGPGGSKEQDMLENQAINRVAGIRGDTALKRIEEQRDASTQVFNTAAKIKSENRLPNQLEYYDMIGQMWKARTGQSPSDQAIRDLDAKTLQGDIGKAYQYFSGKAAPRTTSDILSALQNFADTSGKQADQLHAGYMQTHTIKPTGLEDSRWKPIVESQRGLSYEDATKGARQPIPQTQGQGSGSWTQDNEQRLQMLLDKKSKGTLKS